MAHMSRATCDVSLRETRDWDTKNRVFEYIYGIYIHIIILLYTYTYKLIDMNIVILAAGAGGTTATATTPKKIRITQQLLDNWYQCQQCQ